MSALYPWLQSTWQSWQARLEAEQVPNAILFHAHEGFGADTLVQHFTHAIMCQNFTSEACGFCHSCTLHQSGTHPDIHFIEPEKEGKNISVDQIRNANRWAQESSQLNGSRIIIISPAEAMNESASNALLKTLEEASSSCLFFLVSTSPNKLLKTIQSRCQRWSLSSLDESEMKQWVESQIGRALPAHIFKLNHNAPLSSLAFMSDGQVEEYEAFEQHFLSFVSGSSWDVLPLVSSFVKDSTRQLYWYWLLLSDLQKYHFGLVSADNSPIVEALGKSIDYNHAFSCSNDLREMKTKIEQFPGLNLELLFTDWLLKFK